MNNMITLGDAILLLIGVCVILLLIYMIRAVRALIPGFKSLSKILDDTQTHRMLPEWFQMLLQVWRIPFFHSLSPQKKWQILSRTIRARSRRLLT